MIKIFTKDYWIKREAMSYLVAFLKATPAVMKYKTIIGAAFIVISAWAYFGGCPNEFGVDLTPGTLSCERIQDWLNIIGAALIGGGILPSDAAQKAKEGKVGEAIDEVV